MTSERRKGDGAPAMRRSSAERPHVAAHVSSGIEIRVIKVGGRAQSDASLIPTLASAASAPGTRLVVVHGGGDEVTALQRALGRESQFVGGRRVTSEADLDVVRMVLSGTVNKRLVTQCAAAGVRAVGVSGEDGDLLTACVTDPAMGRVGGDVFADGTLVADLLNGGWTPIISPVARDREAPTGAGLNVNGDDAAAAIASGVGADELLFVADVDGVLEDGRLLTAIDTGAIGGLVSRGVATGGMIAKLDAATMALRNGVRRVRIASLAGITDPHAGTSVTSISPSYRILP